MKSLHLLRHAKSSWQDDNLADFDRPLNKRGTRDAPRMGNALRHWLEPVSINASPARRAQLTLQGLCEGWPELNAIPHYATDELYTFSCNDLLGWLAEQPATVGERFLIGHNPALTELVNWLCPATPLENLPTAGYVQLSLAIDNWSALEPACGEIARSLWPKQLQ